MEEQISTYFQPLVSLKDGSVFAYEALSRGPKDTPMENPMMLFSIAEKANLSFELDRLCRRKAIQNAKGLDPSQKVFVNTYPATMQDPQFKGEALYSLLRDARLKGSNIVFEITEQFAIENYEIFKEQQQYYTERGFELAVDDIGTGYGSLEAIANLKTNYVKIDLSIIRDIHKTPIKQELLKAITGIGRKAGAKIIAEGIETEDELRLLQELDIDFGQGFLFAKPAPHLLPIETRFKVKV